MAGNTFLRTAEILARKFKRVTKRDIRKVTEASTLACETFLWATKDLDGRDIFPFY